MRIRGVIWDFDGTLADTLPVALEVYNELAEERGFEPVTDPHAIRDLSIAEFMRQHRVPPHRLPLTFARFLREIQRRGDRIALHSGIQETVREIAVLGIAQAVVSSNRTKNIEAVLELNQVRSCFQFVAGTSRLFGKERRIRTALKQLQLEPERAIYVGDEIRDIEAAREAGISVAAVTWGMNSPRALAQRSPDLLLDDPRNLTKFMAADSDSTSDDTCT